MMFVAVPVFHVTAVAGDAVYLPCDITTESGDSVLLVLWYREDLGTPIYRSVLIQKVGFELMVPVAGIKKNIYLGCIVFSYYRAMTGTRVVVSCHAFLA
jgi:hypothetical protein